MNSSGVWTQTRKEKVNLKIYQSKLYKLKYAHAHRDCGLILKPGYASWLGITPATFWYMKQQSNQLNHTSQGTEDIFK